MQKCPCCENGKMKITMYTFNWGKPEDKEPDEVSYITCVTCMGSGEVSGQDLLDIEEEKNMWCKCNPSPGSKYHPDRRGVKHHYTCTRCKKVTQIG